MTPDMENHFERELAFLIDNREAFQRRYPAEAGRLIPDRFRITDPHLERFIDGFAALSARLHHKLDSDLPELTESLAQIFHPHLLRPVPSLSLALFEPDPVQPPGPSGNRYPRGTTLRSRPVSAYGYPCRWRTAYPVTVWPIDVAEAQFVRGPFAGAPPRTAAALRLTLACRSNLRFADLAIDRLRFFLSGEKQLIASLYEVMFLNCTKIVVRAFGEKRPPIEFAPADCLKQVGFELDETLLPMPQESFPGFGILTEFLSFPPKFHFFDLCCFDAVRQAGIGGKVEVTFYFNRTQESLEQGVAASSFLLGCTPIINLFAQSAEPVSVTQTRYEVCVVPARLAPDGIEVFSIDEVIGVEEGREAFPLQPFYKYHLGQTRDSFNAFWHQIRRASTVEGDRGTDVFLFVLDGGWNARRPAKLMLDVQTTCTNRDYPNRFLRGGELLRLEPAPETPPGPITLLLAPTQTLRPPLRRGAHWRLLSQMGLDHKTLTDPVEGVRVLQETLRLCDYSDPVIESVLRAVNRQIIEGITSLQTRRVLGRASSGGAIGLCRGIEATLELNEKSYVGIGLFLFACVLERYLGWSAGLNSFNQLVVKTVQGDFVKRWPARAAERVL
jgi:type VI secretion system protein ImpG